MNRDEKPPAPPHKASVAGTPAAERALAEAEARRKARAAEEAAHPTAHSKEIGGPKGPEPTRHDDWERKGIASDF